MTQYATGRPCKRGHIANRFLSNRRCVECHRLYEASSYVPSQRVKHELSWDQRHPERHRIYEQNRRARLAEGQLSANIVQTLLKKQKGLCCYCDADLALVGSSIDHKTPLSRSGTNTDDNVQLACGSCNSKKHSRTHEEFLEVLCAQS